MKCTRCNKQPISFIKFFLKVNPLTFKCQYCGVTLKPSKKIRSKIYGAFAAGFFLVFILSLFKEFNNLGTLQTYSLFALVVLVIGIPVEWYAWNNFTFEK